MGVGHPPEDGMGWGGSVRCGAVGGWMVQEMEYGA